MDSILFKYHIYRFPYVYMDLVDQILRNIDKTPMLCDKPRCRTSASWAKTASKSRILEKLNHDSRRSYIEMNVPNVGFT